MSDRELEKERIFTSTEPRAQEGYDELQNLRKRQRLRFEDEHDGGQRKWVHVGGIREETRRELFRLRCSI